MVLFAHQMFSVYILWLLNIKTDESAKNHQIYEHFKNQ